MARKVKCAVTGKYGTSDDFVKIDGKYYSSYDVYAEYAKSADYWKKLVDVLACDILGYEPGQPFPTLLTKRLKDLEFYDNEVIYKTVIYSKDAIQYSMKMKNFGSDHARISYIMAILKSNINTVFKQVIEERRQLKKPTKTNIDIDGMDETKNPKQETKDISKFLED